MKWILLIMSACASEPPTTIEAGPEPQMEITPIDPITLLPKCARLATSDECCHLACTDGDEFRAKCGVSGACADWVCPVQGGGNFEVEVCKL